MKILSFKILFLSCLFVYSNAFSQKLTPGKSGMWPSSIVYEDNRPEIDEGSVQLTDESGERYNLSEVNLLRKETDEIGMKHYRYQQVHQNIPIEHAIWVVHESDGKISSQNGKLIKTFSPTLEKRATISANVAIQKALDFIGAKKYKWEVPSEENFLKKEQNNPQASFFPKPELIYYSGENDVNPAELRLAYKMDIYSHEPLARKCVFVDAVNSKILGVRELIHETNANGTAITAYSGSRNIRTDYTGSAYRLRETTRGTGNGVINTYNLQKTVNYSGAVDFSDADNTWNNVNANKDEYATDAHWATEMTYDYYLVRHLRNSIDNAGMALNSYVHYSTNYLNAFWDGYRMTYGDGDASNGYKPLTSLDVCGHEITHGVTERTSNLVYSYESGAMNEGFSDIFGTAVEWYARPTNADWLMGSDFYTIRNMSNPNAFSHPDTYLGTYWFTGGGDNGGVHFNSGVLNYWFYLLTAGGSGTNDHGVTFNVSGIGMAKAARIAYKLNTYYLISTSNYTDARILGIQAATDIFGPGSNEVIQTSNAWKAVGLYDQSCAPVANLSSSNISEYGATVSWDATSGAYYYSLQYKAASSSTWISAGTITSTSKILYGLSPATLYDWRVSSSCSGTFSQAQLTTVTPECTVPSNLAAAISGTTVSLEWTPSNYSVSHHLLYKPAADNVWIDLGWIPATTYTLTGLTNNTLYDWKIESDCSFETSNFSSSTFLTDAPSCGAPSGLTVGFSPGLTTTFSWNEVPGAYRYRFQLKWPWSQWDSEGIDEYVTNDTMVYVGFGSGFVFDWRVRAECNDNISSYVQSTVSTPCPAPSGINVTSITSNSAQVSWTASGANSLNGYDVYYKLATSSTWAYAGATSATFFNLGGLLASRLYDVKVRQVCMSYNSSDIQTQFTTIVCGNIPTATATEIKTNAARITWNAINGALSYSLQYKKSTSNSWTTLNGITTNSYQLSGLSATTTYNYQVRAVCSLGNGAFSPLASFTTYCVSNGNTGQEFIDYFSINTISRTSGAESGGYIHTGLSTSLQIGSTGNSGIISAGFSGSTKTEIFAVYLDLNKNGSFADVGELIAGPTTFTSTGNINFTFSVPGTASPGTTGMRVVLLRSGSATMSPCLTGKRGEVEDYFVYLSTIGGAFTADTKAEETQSLPANEMNYSVSPNPSDGIFKVEKVNFVNAGFYRVVNIRGSVIESKSLNENEEIIIDLTNEAAGIYLLQLTDKQNNNQVLKLVKK